MPEFYVDVRFKVYANKIGLATNPLEKVEDLVIKNKILREMDILQIKRVKDDFYD